MDLSQLVIITVSLVWLPLLGIIWIYGTWKNWKFLMDPHDKLWFMWGRHLFYKNFGDKGMKVLNYFLGISVLLGGLYFSLMLYKKLAFLL
jgi:hypothetical protein